MIKVIIKNLIIFFIVFLNFFPALAQDTLDTIQIEQYLSTLPSLGRLEAKHKASDVEEEIATHESHIVEDRLFEIESVPPTDVESLT